MQRQQLLKSERSKPDYLECHAVFWWSVKVAAGAIIIGGLFIGYIYELRPWFSVPRLFAQSLVLLGALSAIYHYLILRSINRNIEQPQRIETKRGLYGVTRHPMYLSDFIAYAGLFLLFPNLPAFVVLMVAYVALIQQSRVEDTYLRQRFDDEFAEWEKRSKMLLPFVY